MTRRQPPVPPHPDFVRRPTEPFGWLHCSLLAGGLTAELGPHALAVLTFLSLAADRRGASFYGRDRMAKSLGMTRYEVDSALESLVDERLVAFRPWRPGRREGVWQLLPLPQRPKEQRAGRVLSIAAIMHNLGVGQPDP